MTGTGQQNDDGWQQRAAMALSAAAAAERLVTYRRAAVERACDLARPWRDSGPGVFPQMC